MKLSSCGSITSSVRISVCLISGDIATANIPIIGDKKKLIMKADKGEICLFLATFEITEAIKKFTKSRMNINMVQSYGLYFKFPNILRNN
jgi:hypothetical protein